MKKFELPEIELINLDVEDVLTTSPDPTETPTIPTFDCPVELPGVDLE